jgi:hypothetical protein
MAYSAPEIYVGARGWQFDDWDNGFYPDDLPTDWRFSFYSNEFQAVLVPYSYMGRYSPEEWGEWAEDTSNDFAFYVEVAQDASWERVQPYLSILGEQLRGVVVVIERQPDLDTLASLIQHLKSVAPISIMRIGSAVSDRDMKTLQSCYEVNECWDGGDQAPAWAYGGAGILLRAEQDQNTPDMLRQAIEKGLGYAGNCDVIALIFDGDPPATNDMRNAQTITELLV